MYFINLFSKVKKIQVIDGPMVHSLYTLSGKSMPAAILLAILITVFLYPSLSYSIVVWCITVTLLLLFRLYYAYNFKVYPQKYSLETWHKKFVVLSFLTAFLFAILGFVSIHFIDQYHQLFIIAALVGYTAGSTISLSSDFRIAIGYISVIIFPLIASMIIVDTPLHNILALLITLYFIAQIIMMFKTYKQAMKIKELEEQKNLLHNLFKEAPLGIFSYDNHLNIMDCNEQLNRLFGHDKEDIIGLNLNDLPDNRPVYALTKALKDGPQSYMGHYISTKDEDFWIESKAFPFTNSRNETIGAIGIIENKTKEHEALKRLEYLAQHDPLTELYNRRGFANYMNELIHKDKHQSFYSLLFYLDLDRFKGINDSLGHSVGDKVLREVSRRLLYMLDSSCKISRPGGDEFIIVVPFVATENLMAKSKAKHYSKQIQDVFLDSYIINEMSLYIQTSIGIILIEPGFMNIEEIIRQADIAMYQAKKSNTNISYYNKELDRKQKELFVLQQDLAYAAEKNQFDLFFQPIVQMKDDTLLSAETLIRWDHPLKGLLGPDEFIHLAIKAGLLSKMTWWIIDRVCQQVSQWKKEKLWKLDYVSININAKQLVEKNFAMEFLKKLKESDLETKDIMIEITERSLIDNFTNTQEVINTLRSHGVRCAIDDFGIGYSSLSYLKKLSFHTLKIDKEFVKEIEHKPQELVLVSTILNIGRQFGYNIVIEGIEDEKQKELLLGLDEELRYQGFYFSKPIHAEEFRQKYLVNI